HFAHGVPDRHADRRAGGEAVQPLVGRVGELDQAARLDLDDAVGQRLDQGAEAALAGVDGLLDALALGDVQGGAAEDVGPAGGPPAVEVGPPRGAQPADRAVVQAAEAVLAAEAAVAGGVEGLVHGPAQAGQLVRLQAGGEQLGPLLDAFGHADEAAEAL